MRKIGIETTAYFGLEGYAEGFKKMAARGYNAADYQNFVNTENGLFAVSEQKFEDYLKDTRAAAEEAGVEIFQTHAPWRWPAKDATPEDRAERLEKMAKSLYGTAYLGSKNMVIHPIMPYGGEDGPDLGAWWEMNLDFFRKLLPVAEETGVKLCLENMPMLDLTVSRPKDTWRMVKDLDHPMMGFCLDTGHAAVFRENPADAVRMLGKNLTTLHIHDNNGLGDFHMLPYQGIIDWEDFRKALLESESEAVLSLETNVPKGLPPKAHELAEEALFRTAKYLAGGEKE